MTDPLHKAIDTAHRELAAQVEAAANGVQVHAPRREVMQTIDAFLIHACRHVGAVCDVILPAARHEFPRGDKRVRQYVHQARRLERAVARTKRRVYGESHISHEPWSEVWSHLGREFDQLTILEREIVADLTAGLDPNTRTALADRLVTAEASSPTRPHPNSLHTGRFAHLSRGLWTRADRFWDAAEGRVVSGAVKAFKAPAKLRPRNQWRDGHGLT